MVAQASVGRLKLILAVGLSVCGFFTGGCPRRAPYECPIPIVRGTPQAACPDWRFIGILKRPGGDCPRGSLGPGWTVRPLFAPPTLRERTLPRRPAQSYGGAETLPAGLRRFCLYEHDGVGADLTTTTLPELIRIDRDCMAVLPAASALTDAALPGLEAHFLRQAGAFDPPVSPPAGSPSVRLALLDTAPTGDDPAANDPPNNSPHGQTLANMAKKLACKGASCTARVTARLALPWVEYEPSSFALGKRDETHGGFVGMIAELAEAVRAEVVDWQAEGSEKALVLNLSVGWNAEFGGLEANVTNMPAPVQAVHAALVDALCRGVGTVAAGGNLTRGEKVARSRGPLLPAAWEGRAAVDATCAAALQPDPVVPLGSGPYRPLLIAAGAVEAGNAPLANARLDAEPRLVAFGDHGVVQGAGDGKATAMLTGSSVGALATSTGEALVRAYDPKLRVFGAVAELYTKSKEIGRKAAVHQKSPATGGSPQGQAPDVHRVLVGQVAAAACQACQGPGCPSPCPIWSPSLPGPLPPGGYGGFASAPLVHLANLAEAEPPTHSACAPEEWRAVLAAAAGENSGTERFHGGGGALVYRCPQWQLYDTTFHAMTGTQPGSDPCSSCGFGGGGGGTAPISTATMASGVLYIEIDPAYIGQLSSPVLKVGDQTYALPDLSPGSRLRIDGVTVGPNDALQLSFVVNGIRSATSLFLWTQ